MAGRGMETLALSVGMMVSGAANSLLNKAQDRVCVAHCDADRPESFEQPVLQTFNMFVGECFCLIVVQLLALRTWWYTRHHQYTALSPSSVAQPTHFHSNQTLNPPNSAIAAPTPAVPLMVDPEAEAPAQDKYPSIREVQGWTRFLFALPALCDITATTLMGAGLIWTPVSVYQMTRSALVLFVGLFSVLFLNRRLSRIELLSLFIVTAGVFIVGLSSASGHRVESAPEDAGQVILGVSLILFAQIFTASQFVIEEKLLTKYSIEPLRVVGLEGIFGLGTTMLIMAITFALIGRTPAGHGGYFDAPTGFSQVFSSTALIWTSLATCCSIALFNFFGLAVTRSVSATARSTIDTCRTFLIWIVSLYLGWETFKPLQVVGFALTVYGTMVFNGVLTFPVALGDEKQSYADQSIPDGTTTKPVSATTTGSRVDADERTALLDNQS